MTRLRLRFDATIYEAILSEANERLRWARTEGEHKAIVREIENRVFSPEFLTAAVRVEEVRS